MENYLLKKRFIFSKRNFIGKIAYYYPTGITGVKEIEIGEDVIIRSQPQGKENHIVEVARNIGSSGLEWSNEIITVFLKDLSPG